MRAAHALEDRILSRPAGAPHVGSQPPSGVPARAGTPRLGSRLSPLQSQAREPCGATLRLSSLPQAHLSAVTQRHHFPGMRVVGSRSGTVCPRPARPP